MAGEICLNPCVCEYKRDKDGKCMDIGWCTFQADDKKAEERYKKKLKRGVK